ncbi:MAG: hypothetical protein ACYDDF_11120 [Thermoplasmatota archaeon]
MPILERAGSGPSRLPLLALISMILGAVGLVGVMAFLVWGTASVGTRAAASIDYGGAVLGLVLIPGLLFAGGLGGWLRARNAGRTASKTRAASAPRGEPRGPPPVAERMSEGRLGPLPRGPVSACLRCGSTEVRPAGMGADALFDAWECSRCGHRGPPIRFETGAEYAEFLKELHAGGPN